jgi:hypothetical protein
VYSARDIIADGVAVAEVLALEVHPHVDEGVLFLAATLSELLSLIQSVVA